MSPAARSLQMATRRGWLTGETSAVLLGGAIHTGLADEATSLQQFRDEVVATLRTRRPNLRLTLPDNPLIVQVDGHEVYLANLYRDCVGQPRERREAQIVNLFDEMLAGFAEPEVKTFEAARPRLRARIVSAEVAANATGRLALVVRPFSAKTRTVYVIDSPTTMAYVSLNTLEKWSVTAEERRRSIRLRLTISKRYPATFRSSQWRRRRAQGSMWRSMGWTAMRRRVCSPRNSWREWATNADPSISSAVLSAIYYSPGASIVRRNEVWPRRRRTTPQ
jgi:hypothetical protein